MPILAQVRVPADTLRSRLEDRAELLETALVRSRALKVLLCGWFWRSKLLRNAGLLHQMAQSEAEVARVLRSTEHRADAEGWSESHPLTRSIRELSALRTQIAVLARRRLRVPAGTLGLSELLLRLDAVLAGPRRILPGQKWITALEVLPRSLPELERAGAMGERLAELFSRPVSPAGGLPFSEPEVTELRTLLPEAEAALQVLWRRVHQCDPSGGLLRFLQKRARRAPTRAPRNGPELLLAAAFWTSLGWTRLRSLVIERFSPVQVGEEELFDLLAWSGALERDSNLRMAGSDRIDEARAALLELSYRLGRKPRESDRRGSWPVGYWDRLQVLAAAADRGSGGEDSERVKETVRLFVQIREQTPQPYGREESLTSVVKRARAAVESKPPRRPGDRLVVRRP